MDLRKEWQKLQEEKFKQSSIKKEDIMNAIYQESSSTIGTLKKRLKAKMNWTLFFIILFLGLMLFNLQNTDFLILIGIFLAAYAIGYVGMWSQYRQMNNQLDFSDSTLTVMKRNDRLMRNALKIEKVFGVCFFPLAVIGGLLFSDVLNGEALAVAIQDAKFLKTALVAIIILVPLMWWASEKMNNSAYGTLMNKLNNNIRRLEDLQ